MHVARKRVNTAAAINIISARSVLICGSKTPSTLIRFRIVFTRPHVHYNDHQEKSRMEPSFWILTVEWAGARSCLFGWRHRFQIASLSPSTLENSDFKMHGFQIAPLWRTFSNDSVFGDRFRRCSVDDIRIRSKTAPFSFENELVWTGPKLIRQLLRF